MRINLFLSLEKDEAKFVFQNECIYFIKLKHGSTESKAKASCLIVHKTIAQPKFFFLIIILAASKRQFQDDQKKKLQREKHFL